MAPMTDAQRQKFAERVRARRAELRLSVAEAAQTAGISKTQWEAAEKGRYRDGRPFNPKPLTLEAMARALREPPEALFAWSGQGRRRDDGRTLPPSDEDVGDRIDQRIDNIMRELERLRAENEQLRRGAS